MSTLKIRNKSSLSTRLENVNEIAKNWIIFNHHTMKPLKLSKTFKMMCESKILDNKNDIEKLGNAILAKMNIKNKRESDLLSCLKLLQALMNFSTSNFLELKNSIFDIIKIIYLKNEVMRIEENKKGESSPIEIEILWCMVLLKHISSYQDLFLKLFLANYKNLKRTSSNYYKNVRILLELKFFYPE